MKSRGARIIYVGTLYPHRGGSAVVADTLLPALAARGFPIVAVVPFAGAPPARWDARLARCGVTVVRFRMPWLESNPHLIPDPSYRLAQQREVRRALADVVPGNGNDILLIGRESFVEGLPEFGNARGMRVTAMLQGVAASILGGHIPADAFPGMIRELSKCDLAISVAAHQAAALAEAGLSNVRTVANGIDIERFRPGPAAPAVRRRLGLPAEGTVVAHVSNLKPVKRAQHFVAAAAIALGRRPDLRFLVLGDGPERAALEQDCARRGIAGRVRFAGWIEREGMPDCYRAVDLVVLPSVTEALPLVGLETMASGRVLIASHIPAARELIEDGRTGLLFPTGDVEKLAGCILQVADRPDLRREIGRAARRHVVQRYTRDRMVDGYERILSELAGAAA